MRKLPFDNESSQAERRAILKNERGGTYHDFAAAEAGAVGGRFQARSKAVVIGSEPIAYPTLPATSLWHDNPLPAEEPLGFDVNAAVEPCGTYEEIQKSLREASGGEGMNSDQPPPHSANDGGRAPLGGLLADASRRPRRLSSKRKKG